MAMGTRKKRERQEGLWYGGELPAAPGHPFYKRLNEVLDQDGFDGFCESHCASFYHDKLGRDASQAKFSGVDVPEANARFMKPGSEGNKVGYFRVLRSTLRFTLASGREKKLELTSLISWRGEWYVVHVAGFK